MFPPGWCVVDAPHVKGALWGLGLAGERAQELVLGHLASVQPVNAVPCHHDQVTSPSSFPLAGLVGPLAGLGGDVDLSSG